MSIIDNPTGHIIRDEGVDIVQQSYLNFIGTGVTITDNPGTGATDVTITGGGGGSATRAFAYFIS